MSLDPTHIPDQPYDSDAVNRARNLLEAIPETVGPYRILERIGIGGMGEVYRAEQRTPIRREVALKLIKLGMDTKLVIARFEAERQALALMDHPHIAKVFDANADDTGRPYFVMEYVKGKPITEYADHQRLSIPERLELFEQVCQAVQHAHHKGVIHRDLKPSNVLVCTQDGKPFSKVIDFGVAKAIVQRLTEKTFFTEDGQFVGTPHYMSPEQAEGSIDIDTRTDVYSLGVLLYELLTGSTPFAGDELRKAAFDQLKRMVIEVDPPKPSTRLQSLSPARTPASGWASALRENAPVPSPPKSGENVLEGRMSGPSSASPNLLTPLETLARHRSTEPKRLSILVRGELDWIVMKALEKDRKRRYETPSSLATDIRSHLTGGAVLAAPPSLWYRTQKFARKYRYALIGTGTAFALLLLAFLGTTYGLRRARIAEATARNSETRAVEARDEAMQERDAKNEALIAEAAQRDLAERQLIEGILRPIGYGDELTTAELRSFADWSQIHDARLKLRVLEIAFEHPSTALRVARRAERAIQACVALSPTRRAKAIELVSAKQRNMQADPRIRVAACWLALELREADLPALTETISFLIDEGALPSNGHVPGALEFSRIVSKYAESPKLAFRAEELASHLSSHFMTLKDPDRLYISAECFVAISPQLSADAIGNGWSKLIMSMRAAADDESGIGFSEPLTALVPKLSDAHIPSALESLISFLKSKHQVRIQEQAAAVVPAMATRLSNEQLAQLAEALIPHVDHSSDEGELLESITALGAIITRLDEPLAFQSFLSVANAVRESDGSTSIFVRREAEAVAGKLTKQQTQKIIDRLIETARNPDDSRIGAACIGLELLAGRMDQQHASLALEALNTLLKTTTDEVTVACAQRAIATKSAHVDPQEIVPVDVNSLVAVLKESSDIVAVRAACDRLLELTQRLDSQHVDKVSAAFCSVLNSSTDFYAVQSALIGVANLAPQINEQVAPSIGDAILACAEKTTNGILLHYTTDAVTAFIPHLNEDIAARYANFLFKAMESQSRTESEYACVAVSEMIPWLGPKEVAPAWDAMTSVLAKSTDSRALIPARKGLAMLVPRLAPEQVAISLNSIIAILDESTDSDSLQTVGDCLVSLAPRMSGEQRMIAANAMVRTLHRSAYGVTAKQIVTVLTTLDAESSDRVAGAAMVLRLNLATTSHPELDGDFSRFPSSIEAEDCITETQDYCSCLANTRSTALMLSHPGCIGIQRASLLQRFEELVFHDGNRVFLNLPEEEGERSGNYENPPSAIPVAGADEHGGLTPNRSPAELPPRRFHTMHDAAVWIQQNWPDFDLEATHPVVWRGEM